jgi:NTE family protein
MKQNDTTGRKTTVSLVLGSGGARGLAHIGVIRWLEENNFEIKSIAGSSIGSLIGGVYAAGKLDPLEKWMRSIRKLDIATLLDVSWSSGGIFKGNKIINKLIDLLEDARIENLPIPFTAVATDIVTEKEVWINKGSLFDAIRASASLPLFFTPIKNKGTILIDGGVLNPLPIAPTFKDETDLTIAVNLGGALLKLSNEIQNEVDENKGWDKFQQNIKEFVETFSKKDKEPKRKTWGMYDVADKAIDTMQSSIARLKIASYPPDVLIEIARNACGTLEFDRADEMIKLGYNKTKTVFMQDNHGTV